MLKIASHDSVTGEESANFLSKLCIPFVRTQSKTLIEQWLDNTRLFDIRIVKHKGQWYGAHGLWRTKRTITSLLSDLNGCASIDTKNPTYVNIVYEGTINDKVDLIELDDYISFAKYCMSTYTNIQFGDFFSKYPHWNNIYPGNLVDDLGENPDYIQYKKLDFSSWHTLIPIPILWKQFYFKHPKYIEEGFAYADFV